MLTRLQGDRRFRIVLLFSSFVLGLAGLCRSMVAADDARLQPGSIDEKRFFRKILDADNEELKAKIQSLRKAGAEPRQFLWDRLELEDRPRNAAGLVRPAVRIEMKGPQPRATSIGDGETCLFLEAVSAGDDAGEADAPEQAPIIDKKIRIAGKAHIFAQKFRIAKTEHDEAVFGRGKDAQAARRHVEELLRSKIAAIDRVCTLTPDQAEKLRLAGQGDIHRLFERADELRIKFDAASEWDAEDLRTLMTRVTPLINESKALRDEAFSGSIFASGSLFAKMLQRVLTPEQAARRAGRAHPASVAK
jgi:hypothetical protein